MDKEKLLEIIDKLVARSERWEEDAVKREDQDDLYFYKGQQDMANELKQIISQRFD